MCSRFDPLLFGSRLTDLRNVDTEYMDRLELRNSTDRTLGLGVLPSAGGELLVLTAATMMKVYVDVDQIAKFDPECVPYLLYRERMF